MAGCLPTPRSAAVLQQIFEVDPPRVPGRHGAMRIVAFITQRSVIDQILAPLRTRAATAIAPYVRGILDRARLNFLLCSRCCAAFCSRARMGREGPGA